MESGLRRLSASHSSLRNVLPSDLEEPLQADPSRLKPGAQLTLMRYLQDLPDAEAPHTDAVPPRFHTGRLPNSKAGDGKPRLLLMGQRRCVVAFCVSSSTDCRAGAANHQYQA